ncbi:MAG: hypothetical protein H6618_10010, partial [Deltaproteobacteria bacterium]|nr:hypothetical protein [Deltaproteobacteria bacterium]
MSDKGQYSSGLYGFCEKYKTTLSDVSSRKRFLCKFSTFQMSSLGILLIAIASVFSAEYQS